MEVWKFISYSNSSTILALSLTAKRWGLDPFPANAVAIPGTWHDFQTSNSTAKLASILPYTCSDNASSYLDSYVHNYSRHDHSRHGYHSDYTLEESYKNVTANSSICTRISRTQPCNSSCLILIEGIGRNTTGPAHVDIVGLTHGISALISVLATILITMGWFDSNTRKKRASDRQVATVIKGAYNPPAAAEKKLFVANLQEEYNAAKDVAHCSKLLRQMYTLDLAIWAMEDSSAAEIPQREELKDRANALFEEIRDIVQMWQKDGGGMWTIEERMLVDEISMAVLRYPAQRYELGMRAVAKRR